MTKPLPKVRRFRRWHKLAAQRGFRSPAGMLRYMALKMNAVEIARDLKVHPRTVRNHLAFCGIVARRSVPQERVGR